MECRYVGQSVNAKARMRKHIWRAKTDKLYKSYIHSSNWIRSVLATGREPLLHILESCTPNIVDEREVFWIAKRRAEGCDLTNHADGGGGTRGYKLSDEQRAKMSLARRGKKRGPMSAEGRANISRSQTGKKRGPMSEEHRASISRGNKGRVKSDLERQHISERQRGQKSHNSLLTNAQAVEIRSLVAGGAKQCDVAVQFGVERQVVNNIVRRRNYKDC